MLATEREDLVNFMNDMRHFYYLDPYYSHQKNIFIDASVLRMRQQYWDIFEFLEYDESIIEQHG